MERVPVGKGLVSLTLLVLLFNCVKAMVATRDLKMARGDVGRIAKEVRNYMLAHKYIIRNLRDSRVSFTIPPVV